ncbi:hypothetical protein EDD63_15014 [Breznakia blatticola]|uniref:Uncharacterized protein n=1 Tax=Breznakia blatticola TaxID=1754012 RepID=A0A4R7ZA43_9FIRM|nr:hypothetical protein [Breznakia blatticola]TDW13108.1 hypothetical protein EDD63_15014 [Breznakia blatticola]
MSNRSKAIGLGLFVLILIIFTCFIFVKPNTNRNITKIDNTVRWEYKESETIELKNTDLLYDDSNMLIKPSSSDDQSSYYNLVKGEYKLKTRVILNDEPVEIKIIVY